MGTSMLSCWEGKTDLFMQEEQRTLTTKNYTVESGPNTKEIEVGTRAESEELQFQLTVPLPYRYTRLHNRDTKLQSVDFGGEGDWEKF